MYRKGHGVIQDDVRAHMWFNLAAIEGNEHSIKNRELVASHMTPQQVAKAQKMASDCQESSYKRC